MKLLFAYIRPHIAQTNVHVWIASKAQADDIECNRQGLIRNLDVNMLQKDYISDVFV
jgi:hypothetical protein